MKPSRLLVPVAASILACLGCRSGGHDDEIEPQAGVPERDVVVVTREPEVIDDDRRVWRFPFVTIAINPADPRSVGVRVAEEDDSRPYVDLDVNWDDE